MSDPPINHKIILTEPEFDYVQHMIDSGSAIDQALLEVRPELSSQALDLKESVVIVHRSSHRTAILED